MGPSQKNLTSLYYNTYDITSALQQGDNILGAVCYAEDTQAFLCQITAFYQDGTQEVLCNSGESPSNWQTLDANGVFGYQGKSIASYYQASPENLNGAAYPYGWNQLDFNASEWKTPANTGDIEAVSYTHLDVYKRQNQFHHPKIHVVCEGMEERSCPSGNKKIKNIFKRVRLRIVKRKTSPFKLHKH